MLHLSLPTKTACREASQLAATSPTLVSFTPLEAQALLQRLQETAGVARALTSDRRSHRDASYTYRDAFTVVVAITDLIKLGRPISVVTQLTRDILFEAVDGSWWGKMTDEALDDEEISSQQHGARWKLMRSISSKLAKHGINAKFRTLAG